MNILLLAPPAAGKGTQADLLQKKYGVVAISTGQLLREAAKKNDMLGLKLKEVLKTGQLVEDGIVLELLQNRFSELQGSSFLLDGFPRNIRQAELLDELLVSANKKLDYVFFLDVPKEELERVKDLVLNAMVLNQPLSVPLEIDINCGNSWKEN